MEQLVKKDSISSAKFTLPLQKLNWDYTKKYEDQLRNQDIHGILQSEYDGITRLARFYTFIELLNLKLDDVSLIHLDANGFSGEMSTNSRSMGKPLFFSLTPDVPEYKMFHESRVANYDSVKNIFEIIDKNSYDYKHFVDKNSSYFDFIGKLPFSVDDVVQKVEEKTIFLPHKSGTNYRSATDNNKNAVVFASMQDYVQSVLDRDKVPIIMSEYMLGNGHSHDFMNWGDEFLSLKGVHLHFVSLPDIAGTLDWTKSHSANHLNNSLIEDYFTKLHENANMPRNKYKKSCPDREVYTYFALNYFAEPRKPTEMMIQWNKDAD